MNITDNVFENWICSKCFTGINAIKMLSVQEHSYIVKYYDFGANNETDIDISIDKRLIILEYGMP